MIPGSNLLNMAFTVIAKQTITYYRATGRTLNNVGQDVTTYAPGVTVLGSFQPVPRKLYELYGLDLQKSYFTFYASSNIIDVTRDVSGDQLSFKDERYQCESNNDWFQIDGWKGVLCVHIGPDVADSALWGFNETPSVNTYLNFNNGNFIAGDG